MNLPHHFGALLRFQHLNPPQIINYPKTPKSLNPNFSHMQVSEMASFHHILRSQSSLLLKSSKFNLFYPSINSLILLNQPLNQNPNFSRHFHLIHSINPKLSPESPLINVDSVSKENPSSSTPQETVSETTPRVWSVYNSVKPVNSDKEEEGVGKRVNLSSNAVENVGSRGFVGRGRKGKIKVNWVCCDCGHSEGQWWGTCKNCNKVGTLQRFSVAENERSSGRVSGYVVSENVMKRSWLPEQMGRGNSPVRLADVNRGVNHLEWRIRL